MEKGQGLIVVVVGVLILVAVAGGAFYLGTKRTETFGEKLSKQNPMVSFSPGPSGNKPAPDTKPQNDETTNWDTFTSKYFGFSHKYPKDWTNDNFCYQCSAQPIKDSSDERYFHPQHVEYPKGITYIISSKKSTTLKVIEDKVKDWNFENKKIEEIVVDGYKGIKVSGLIEDIESRVVVFENKDYIFEISNHEGYADILDLMISTLKFL